MATEGKITGKTNDDYEFTCYWVRNSFSETNNTSNITVNLRVQRTDGYLESAYNLSTKPTVTLIVGGTTRYPDIDFIDTRKGALRNFATWTGNVSHADDGTLSLSISASFTLTGTSSLTGGTLGGYATLDTIARASTITSAANVTLGNNCSVKWTPKSTTFWYQLKFSLGDWSYESKLINPKQKTAYTYTGYTIPIEDVAEQLPTSKTGTMKVTLKTFSDAGITKVGSDSSKTFTVTVPQSAAPTVSMALSPSSNFKDDLATIYIQGKTKVKADFSDSKAKYGAEITAYRLTAMGNHAYGEKCESDWLSTSGMITIKGRVVDSRGYYTDTDPISIYVFPYSKPVLAPYSGNSIVCKRWDSEEDKASDSGTSLKIQAVRSYHCFVDGEIDLNFCGVYYRYKTEDGKYTAYSELLAKSDGKDDINAIESLQLDPQTAYVVQLYIVDDVGESSTYTFYIPTEDVPLHLGAGGKAVGLGRYAGSDKTISVGWDMVFDEGTTIRGVFADCVSEIGLYTHEETDTIVSGSWRYRKWASGTYDISGIFYVKPTENNSYASGVGYYSNQIQIQLPFDIKTIQYTGTPTEQHYWLINAALAEADENIIGFRLARFIEIDTTNSVPIRLVGHGRWK